MGQRKISCISLMFLAVIGWTNSPKIAHADQIDFGNQLGSISFSFDPNGVNSAGVYVSSPQSVYDVTLQSNGASLYCVDLGTGINPIAGYDLSNNPIYTYSASVNHNGTVDSLIGPNVNNPYATDSIGTVSSNADVAWLVEHSNAKTADEKLGLQAAIWAIEYGNLFVLNGISDQNGASSKAVSAYSNDLIALSAAIIGTDPPSNSDVGNVNWVSPVDFDAPVQGFVGVPEPNSLILAAFGIAGAIGYRLRSRKPMLCGCNP